IVYPTYSTGAMVTTAAVSFGVGVMMGAMWSGCCHSGYGWGMGWHGGGNNNITINNNFSGNRTTNVSGGNRTNVQGGNSWQHNSAHRKSVPYSNRDTAQKFGGSSRDSAGRVDRSDRNGQERAGGDRSGVDRAGQNRDAGNRDAANRDRGQSGARDTGGDRMGDR